MSLELALGQMGINIASSLVYDVAKGYFSSDFTPTKDELQKAIASSLNIENANIYAEKIIELLAKNGDIIIGGTTIRAAGSILMASSEGTQISMRNSESNTENTKISVLGHGASLEIKDGAFLKQEDGSITLQA